MPIFKGTAAEGRILTGAIDRNCECRMGVMGIRLTTCPGHTMLLEDQKALDALLFVRHMMAARAPGAGQRIIPLTS